jgi:methylenetetrahydrofolate dehydrogenase (NADP+)/methenyltetrahydrofolate cyclohydrolase
MLIGYYIYIYYYPSIFKADIVVACAGSRNLIRGEWIKRGAIVIDAGINRGIPGVDAKKIVGDVEFAEVQLIYIYM